MRNKNEEWNEDDFTEVTEEKIPPMKGFDEESARQLQPLMERFMGAYAEKPEEAADASWLDEHLKAEMPDKTEEEIQSIRQDIQKSVAAWDENMQSLDDALSQGQTKEEWLEGKMQEATVGANVSDYGKCLALTNVGLHQENQKAISLIDGEASLVDADFEIVDDEQDWNTENTHELAVQIGKEVEVSSLASTVLSTGWKLAEQLPISEKLSELKQVGDALRSGDDQGLKEAASAALKSGVEKGYIPILPKDTPTSVVSGIACFGVEQAKVMVKFADGEISSGQALNLMGRAAAVNTVNVFSHFGEKIGRQIGQKIGLAVGTIVPVLAPVGAAVGSFVGATIGRIGGSAIGKAVTKAAKKLAEKAKPVLKRAWEGIKSVGRTIMSGIKSLLSILD